ncbi:MAG: hypothetical protein JWQ11_3668 [Rhizobacter sp.]|nr:hypothetical protein [Rhizobacter sp.]
MTNSTGSPQSAYRSISVRRLPEHDDQAAAAGRNSPLPPWSSGSDGGTATTAPATTAPATQAAAAQLRKQPTVRETVKDLLRTLDIEALPNCGFQRLNRSMSSVHRMVNTISAERIASVPVHLSDRLVAAAEADPQAAACIEAISKAQVPAAPTGLDERHGSGSTDKGCGTHVKASLLDALNLVALAPVKRSLRAEEAARMVREALRTGYENRLIKPTATTSIAAAILAPSSASGQSRGAAAAFVSGPSLDHVRSGVGSPVRFSSTGSPTDIQASGAEPVPMVDLRTPSPRPASPRSVSRSTFITHAAHRAPESTLRSSTPPGSFRPIDPAAVASAPSWLGAASQGPTPGSSPPAKRQRQFTDIGEPAKVIVAGFRGSRLPSPSPSQVLGTSSAGALRWSTASNARAATKPDIDTDTDSSDAPITNADVDALLAKSRTWRDLQTQDQRLVRQMLERCNLQVPHDFKLAFPASGSNEADHEAMRRANAVKVLRLFPADAKPNLMAAALKSLNQQFPVRLVLVTVRTIKDSREWRDSNTLPGPRAQAPRFERTPSSSA